MSIGRPTGCVWGDDDIFHVPERAVGRQGFFLKHVQASTGDFAVFEALCQSGFIDDGTACSVDQKGGCFSSGSGCGALMSFSVSGVYGTAINTTSAICRPSSQAIHVPYCFDVIGFVSALDIQRNQDARHSPGRVVHSIDQCRQIRR